MKNMVNYKDFYENYKLNENFLGKTWGAIVNYFRKKYGNLSWLYYALYLKKNGQLPKDKVNIIIPKSIKAKLNANIDEEEEKFESLKSLKEAKISLSHNDPNVRNVDVEELMEEIKTCYYMNVDRVDEGKPRSKTDALYIWGAPGIGKTEILKQVADELEIVVIEFHLSQIEPTDFRGVPKIENKLGSNNPDDERTVTKLPEIFPTNNGINGKGGIMFFDEINRAPKMVLSAALPLCLNGKHGTYELPSKWIVIAAGNRPEDLGGAVATSIEPALANRFSHINYAPTVDSYIEWCLTKPFMNPDIAAFLKWNKEYFHDLDPEIETMNWPSPRTWELASRKDYFKRGKNWKNKLPYKTIENIYTDAVGRKTAAEFVSYLKLKEKYNENDVRDVYTKGPKAKKLPTRLDESRAACASIAFFKKGEELKIDELKNVLDFALTIENFETKTSLMSFIKTIHPYIKAKQPWKALYDEYVKKWYKDSKEFQD